MTERDIFIAALQQEDPARRQAYLDQACAGQPELRRQVEGLLRLSEGAGSFLEKPVAESAATGAFPEAGQRESMCEAPGTVIGPYRLLEQIGEGGFGVVYLAEQARPVRRKVALKVLKPGMDTRQVVARFEAERQALAIMDHPNIARVFDGGATPSGRPYFVMELVKGVPITDFCDQNQRTPRQRLELFVPVCQAVQHAHQKGVIHRDLKPSNVLVSRHDTTPVVKVIDFGIAKAVGQQLTDKTLFTGLAQMVGTPLYMSPEQAGMSDLDVDTRSDVYSLGVLLYELLTGTTPLDKDRFKAAGYDEIRRIIREDEPARPSTRLSTLGPAAATVSSNRGSDRGGLTRVVRGELDWIVMKALEKDRNRRYESANGLATDVQRFLAGEAVQAVPPSAGYRLRKFVHRNRREVLIAGVTTVAAAGGVAGLAVSRALIARALQSETEAKERERLEAYFQRITVAHRELSIDNLAAALRALNECPEDLRGWEWDYLMRLGKVEPLVIRDRAEVNGVAFSSDGGRLASAGGDGRVTIWNSKTGDVSQRIPAHTKSVVCVSFHRDGRRIAAVDVDNQVKVWDWTTGREEFAAPCDFGRKFGTTQTAAFSPDGRWLAAGSDGVVRIWDLENGRVLHPLYGHKGYPISVTFSRDGRHLASASTGDDVKLWDLEGGGQLLRTFPAHGHPVSALEFSPDGGRLAEANLNRCVNLWDTTTGELCVTLVHTGNVLGVAFSPDGKRLASSSEDKTVRVWDPTTGREILGLRGHKDMCGCVAFSPDGLRLASCSTDRTIRIWDATPLRGDEGQEVFTFPQNDEVRSVAFSPNGRRFAAAGIGTLVKTWDMATGKPGVEFNPQVHVVFCLAWQPPDGRRIALACWDGRIHGVKVWDVQDGQKDFPPVPGSYAVAFSPDGRYLVTGRGSSGVVEVWDAQEVKPVSTLGAHEREIRGLVFSPDRKHLASASGDGKVKLWDATRLDQKQAPLHTLEARVPGPCLNVAFSPDSPWLATGGEENTVQIWDVGSGRELRPPLRGHTGEVYAVAVSPDGRWVASGGEDSTVKVWDCRHDFRLVRSFRGHTGLVSSLAFSPDSRRLVSGSRDHKVKVWDVSKLGDQPSQK